MDKRLPVIDVAPLFGADAAGKSVVAVDLHASCKSRGFSISKIMGSRNRRHKKYLGRPRNSLTCRKLPSRQSTNQSPAAIEGMNRYVAPHCLEWVRDRMAALDDVLTGG